jgi:hypothetical protein
VSRIAKEVARQYETHSEREAATEFVLQHELSTNAFHRRLVRSDVVLELRWLFELSKANHSIEGTNPDGYPGG